MTWLEGCESISIDGERAAPGVTVESLVAAHSGLLFRVAHAVLRDRAEAEDVVQEAFLRVVKHRGALYAIREPRVWLVRIAWNLALDRRRRTRPDQMDDAFAASLADCSLAADAALAEARRLRAVLHEMNRLPAAERSVLLLTAVDEMSTEEVAKVLRRSNSGVRALLFRARARLRERLESREANR